MNLSPKSAKHGRPIVYWDTCVFIAWLIGETDWPESVLCGIAETVSDIEDDHVVVCTSSITRTEVFYGELTDDQKHRFSEMFRRKNWQEVSVTRRVADRASGIREHYSRLNPSIAIRTPDAIHLATAIVIGAQAMYTLDGAGKRCRPNNLLSLNGNVAGFPLVIQVPCPRPQPMPEPAEGKDTDLPLFPLTEESQDKGNPDGLTNLSKPPELLRSGDEHSESRAGAEGTPAEAEGPNPVQEIAGETRAVVSGTLPKDEKSTGEPPSGQGNGARPEVDANGIAPLSTESQGVAPKPEDNLPPSH